MWFCCSSVFGFPCSKTSYNWIYRQCCQKSHSRAQKLVTNFQHITYQLPSMGKIRLFTPSHVCSLPAAGLHLIVIQYLLSVAMELGTGLSANNDLLYTPLASTSPLAKHKGTEREWDDSEREWNDWERVRWLSSLCPIVSRTKGSMVCSGKCRGKNTISYIPTSRSALLRTIIY